MTDQCECTDPSCECNGRCREVANTVLFRVDMNDETGTAMCDACAEDAMQSGVFDENPLSARALADRAESYEAFCELSDKYDE